MAIRRHVQISKAFTLIELLVVMVVISILAAVIVPKFANRKTQSSEAALIQNLRICRHAVEAFRADCESYPLSLADLTLSTSPTNGSDSSGNNTIISSSSWHGQYLTSVLNDPVSGTALTYAKSTGRVSSSATGNASNGTAYSSW